MKKPLLSELTLREKIGQCLIPYPWYFYRECETDYRIQRTDEERKALIQENQFGAYWEGLKVANQGVDLVPEAAGKLDYETNRQMLAMHSSWTKIPALMAADAEHEGAGTQFNGLTSICGPLALGAANSEQDLFELGKCVAKELRCAGINWRWAPPVDISNRFSLAVMRSISPDDPDKMIRLTNSYIKGMQSEGLAATAKHFPGNDRYEYRDGHFCNSILSSSEEEWWSEQGRIFQEIFDGGVYSVMVGFTSFPAIDDTKINEEYIPSAFSKKIVTDLLKGKMNFKGVVVTDAVEMASCVSTYSDYKKRMVELLKAGNDVILGCELRTAALLEEAVLEGELPESRIDDACQRIIDMKEKMGLFEDNYFSPPYKGEDVVKETQALNQKIAEKSITLVRDKYGLIPVKQSDIKHVTIVCSSHSDGFSNELECMKKEFEARGATVTMQRRVGGKPDVKRFNETSDLIIYVAYVASHVPMGWPTLFGDECRSYIYAFGEGREKSIGVSMGYPYIHYDIMGNAPAFINTYGKNPDSMKAFVKAVYGEIPLVGESPVKLIPDHMKW